MDSEELSISEIKELLEIYGYLRRSDNLFVREFNECQIIIKISEKYLEFTVKTINHTPRDSEDLYKLNFTTISTQKYDIKNLEQGLLTSFQFFRDLVK